MSPAIRLSAEDELIDWLRRLLPGGALLGDDTANLGDLGSIAVSIDQQIAGTHFAVGLDPAWLARRLLEVSLSDLAASGAHPRYCFLALSAPPDWQHRRFLTAFGRACERRGILLGGGDLARSSRVGLTLCVIGDRPRSGRFVARSGARPGDRLWVGGALGTSALGRALVERGAYPVGRELRLPAAFSSPPRLARAARRALRAHLAPRAQLELGKWLGQRRRAAAIDVSDGFALDLARLCRESGVGAVVEADALPWDTSLLALAERLEVDPVEATLSGGEDYVLLFSIPRSVRPPAELGCAPVGRITSGLRLLLDGDDRELAPSGWSHL